MCWPNLYVELHISTRQTFRRRDIRIFQQSAVARRIEDGATETMPRSLFGVKCGQSHSECLSSHNIYMCSAVAQITRPRGGQCNSSVYLLQVLYYYIVAVTTGASLLVSLCQRVVAIAVAFPPSEIRHRLANCVYM